MHLFSCTYKIVEILFALFSDSNSPQKALKISYNHHSYLEDVLTPIVIRCLQLNIP